jgi:hypothetical protein
MVQPGIGRRPKRETDGQGMQKDGLQERREWMEPFHSLTCINGNDTKISKNSVQQILHGSLSLQSFHVHSEVAGIAAGCSH